MNSSLALRTSDELNFLNLDYPLWEPHQCETELLFGCMNNNIDEFTPWQPLSLVDQNSLGDQGTASLSMGNMHEDCEVPLFDPHLLESISLSPLFKDQAVSMSNCGDTDKISTRSKTDENTSHSSSAN